MSTVSYAMQDSATMLRRNLRRTLRYPVAAAAGVGMPIVFLLLFVFVFGETMGAGLAGVSGGRDEYLDYVTPGIILIVVAGAAQGTAGGSGTTSRYPSSRSVRVMCSAYQPGQSGSGLPVCSSYCPCASAARFSAWVSSSMAVSSVMRSASRFEPPVAPVEHPGRCPGPRERYKSCFANSSSTGGRA